MLVLGGGRPWGGRPWGGRRWGAAYAEEAHGLEAAHGEEAAHGLPLLFLGVSKSIDSGRREAVGPVGRGRRWGGPDTNPMEISTVNLGFGNTLNFLFSLTNLCHFFTFVSCKKSCNSDTSKICGPWPLSPPILAFCLWPGSRFRLLGMFGWLGRFCCVSGLSFVPPSFTTPFILLCSERSLGTRLFSWF